MDHHLILELLLDLTGPNKNNIEQPGVYVITK